MRGIYVKYRLKYEKLLLNFASVVTLTAEAVAWRVRVQIKQKSNNNNDNRIDMPVYKFMRKDACQWRHAVKTVALAVVAASMWSCGSQKSDESVSVQEELRNTHLLEAMKVVDVRV